MIKAIPTIYNGVEYRSRLEAQVACLLTNLGADFQYEPQGFDLGDGLKYLPDFFVTNNCAYENPSEHKIEKHGCYKGEIGPKQFWIEVKGSFANKERDEEKVLKFANATNGEVCFCNNKEFYPPKTPLDFWAVPFEESNCEFKNSDKCWQCKHYIWIDPQRDIENPILVIDELPPINILKNIFVLLDWCRKKRDGLAVGAKEVSSWSFDYLQEICYGGSGEEETLFNDSLAPCLCVDVKGGFHLAPSYFGSLVEIDELRTLDAYKKALEVGKWSPPSYSSIPTANYSKATLELFAKKAREKAIGAF